MKGRSSELIVEQVRHENGISKPLRKEFGIYLTNNIDTVDEILNIIDFEDPKLLDRKIVEPSCGNGVFVIRLLERLFEAGHQDSSSISRFIESNLFFVDINKEMILKTENNVKELYAHQFGVQYTGDFNSYVYDFTQKISPKSIPPSKNTIETSLVKLLEEIDYVIGNPPYVTLYGRRDKKQSEAQRIYYLNNYSQFPRSLKNGKINYVMLFLEQSIDLLKKGGKLSFIIDLAFFETAYEHTRKYLLENTKILSLKYNIKDFEVASGQVIIELQKHSVENNLVEIIDAESKAKVDVDQALWYMPKDQFKFRFNTCAASAAIIDKIKIKNCPTLKSLYPKKNLRTCVMLLNMENLFVFNTKRANQKIKAYPYYQGSKGLKRKYGRLESTTFFHYNKELQDKVNDELKAELTAKGIKNKKRLGLGEMIIYDNPKVYIRQSAKEIIASYDEKPSSANNSLYVFTLRDSQKQSVTFLKYLCGLLNSDLITFYAQQLNIIRFSKGKQPQIKTSDLYQIPVPLDSGLHLKVASLVDEIYSETRNAEEVKNEINVAFNEFFELSSKEVESVQNAISNF